MFENFRRTVTLLIWIVFIYITYRNSFLLYILYTSVFLIRLFDRALSYHHHAHQHHHYHHHPSSHHVFHIRRSLRFRTCKLLWDADDDCGSRQAQKLWSCIFLFRKTHTNTPILSWFYFYRTRLKNFFTTSVTTFQRTHKKPQAMCAVCNFSFAFCSLRTHTPQR